ncbi:MAG: zinc-binding dehydrogenase, partial [Rhizobacter sp.]|nr:zinc-binding dehydrogenase [Chlorobiales bacterium]
LQKIFWKQLSLFGSTMGSPKDFSEMLAFVGAKKIKPIVDKVFPLAEAEPAVRYMDAALQFGKIVLDIS